MAGLKKKTQISPNVFRTCLTSAPQTLVIRRVLISAKTSWATSSACAQMAGEAGSVTKMSMSVSRRMGAAARSATTNQEASNVPAIVASRLHQTARPAKISMNAQTQTPVGTRDARTCQAPTLASAMRDIHTAPRRRPAKMWTSASRIAVSRPVSTPQAAIPATVMGEGA